MPLDVGPRLKIGLAVGLILLLGFLLLGVGIASSAYIFGALAGCRAASDDEVVGTYLEPFQWTFGVEILKLRPDQTFEERFDYFDGDTVVRHGTWSIEQVDGKLQVTLMNLGLGFWDRRLSPDSRTGSVTLVASKCQDSVRLERLQVQDIQNWKFIKRQ